jgi:pimeloyl-ACP methyl ester carboxylesterase
MKPVLYLHGFASSPDGRKSRGVAEALAPFGIRIVAIDLNVPSFAALDFDAAVAYAVETAAAEPPQAIVGSSLGGLMALAAIRRGVTVPAVLIAPALGIHDLWLDRLPDGDPIAVPNYATNHDEFIHRRFFERMSQVDVDIEPPPVPVTVISGTLDESVPFERVEEVWRSWERSGSLVTGSKFVPIAGGDHGLTDSIPRIAEEIRLAVETRHRG